MRVLRASPLRPIGALFLALGLLPGITGGLAAAVEAGAHCNHACCKGLDFCAHGSRDPYATDEHPHSGKPDLAIRNLRAADDCRETCGVLCQLSFSKKNATGSESTKIAYAGSTRISRPSTSPFLRPLENVRDASPRAPPA